MAVLTFSRTYGCGVRELGQELAQELDYMYFNKELIPLIFKRIREEKEKLKSQQSWTYSLTSSMINIVYSTFPFVRIASLGENYFTNSLTKVISDLADKGNIIILGRGSQIILKDHPNTFHIRFTADLDYRVEHLQKAHTMQNMPREEIIQTIRQEDKNRKEFIKYNFNQDIDNPLLYHLIIDCSKTSSAKIKQLIKNLID